MQIEFTLQAKQSILEIGEYLLNEDVPTQFVKTNLLEIRDGIRELLSTFPESGVPFNVDNTLCRKVIVKSYSILYSIENNKVIILLVYKQNLPHLNTH